MRSQVARRLRTNSTPLSSVPPAPSSTEYSIELANLAARILYRSPLPSLEDLPVYILNSWGFPDARTTNYDALLPYVLSRLPDEEELIGGNGYEIVFFAGGDAGNEAGQTKRSRPGWGWFLQAYHVLTRATRKRLQKLYIVHEKKWIRILVETFATVVSPKFRKKIVHVSTISGLSLHLPIEDLLIPLNAYISDRRKSSTIFAAHASGRRAFAVKRPLPVSSDGSLRLPRVLREATSFIIMDENITTEGLFRINARAQTVEILREAYDRGQKFIVWRERDAVLASSYRREGTGDVWVEELDQTEGYDIHTAAALVKLWYKELREPIFPLSSYQALEKFYGHPSISLDPPQLLAMLSMDDEWSIISNKTSRQILTMHLIPLLSKVAESSDRNQMTPDNLAVCFAPNLLCGPDPIEDLKMSGLIRRILVAMITYWKTDLAPLFNTSFSEFEVSLRMPEATIDREDPLEEEQTQDISELEAQTNGITLLDNEDSDEEEEMEGPPPPLPPRPLASTSTLASASATTDRNPSTIADSSSSYDTGTTTPAESSRSNSFSPIENSTGNVRRKPAPALAALPRYSTIINDRDVNGRPVAFQGERYYNSVAPEEEEDEIENGNVLNAGRQERIDEMNDLPPYNYDPDPEGNVQIPARAMAPDWPPRLPSRAPAADTSPVETSIQRKPVPESKHGADGG
ncbi:hypothetical protein ACLMJK_007127 [Lecanora helva]